MSQVRRNEAGAPATGKAAKSARAKGARAGKSVTLAAALENVEAHEFGRERFRYFRADLPTARALTEGVSVPADLLGCGTHGYGEYELQNMATLVVDFPEPLKKKVGRSQEGPYIGALVQKSPWVEGELEVALVKERERFSGDLLAENFFPFRGDPKRLTLVPGSKPQPEQPLDLL